MSTSTVAWVNLGVSKLPVVNSHLLKPQDDEGSPSLRGCSCCVSPVAAMIEDADDDNISDGFLAVQVHNVMTPPLEEHSRLNARNTVSALVPLDSPPLCVPHMLFPALLTGPNVGDPLSCDFWLIMVLIWY
ncbi:hypothetical protein K435DRAFT_852204 [Dendrothele bispora CBS 962.96]|uniref:Uncharacterized protein n=1 Tax=Dendrothele bispora (strain CBS 962.96) TaxID=1314807 RepID=A0A4S8MKX6_DENBC|nr:hypothetical protein K435DRAFT_852204 [Dendrothele bispora CBS 962.96]